MNIRNAIRRAADLLPITYLKIQRDMLFSPARSLAPLRLTQPLEKTPYIIEHTYPDQGHGSFSIVNVPPSTRLVRFPVRAGRWLDPMKSYEREGVSEVVLNHIARDRAIALGIDTRIGSVLRLTHGGHISTLRIVGIVEDIGSQASAYVPGEREDMLSDQGTVILRVAFSETTPASVAAQTRLIEGVLEERRIPIDMIFSTGILRNAVGEHMTVLVSTLTAAALLMAIVGFLGLISTMTMTIVERTREIGIMRAMGGRSATLQKLLILEGLWTVAGSLPLAWLLSLLLSSGIGDLVGTMAFRTPLPLVSTPGGLTVWTALLFIGTLLSVMAPVRQALRISTREALAYEG